MAEPLPRDIQEAIRAILRREARRVLAERLEQALTAERLQQPRERDARDEPARHNVDAADGHEHNTQDEHQQGQDPAHGDRR